MIVHFHRSLFDMFDNTFDFYHQQRSKRWQHATPSRGRRHDGSHNHGKGESKVRRKLAKESRRINRRG